MPFLLHRYVKKDRLEEAEKYGLWDCTECGLCSHVCLAKREMSHAFFEARRSIKAAGEEASCV
jgi:Na+-translocating ferredoxin:NAD+ oxidoreductase RnfC subunit